MARGGKRAQRAKRGAGKGFSGGGGAGNGLAQSAGIVRTFQGTSGGGAFGNRSGGSKGTKRIGRETLANGTSATIRSPGGDATTVKGALPGARVGPNLATQQGNRGNVTRAILPHLRKGAQYGRGGSTQ